MDLKEQIKQIIADVSCLTLDELKDETKIEQLGLDSLDFVQITYFLDEKLRIKPDKQFSFEEINHYTIGEFLDLLVKMYKNNLT